RPAELARDHAVHPDPRSRSRRTARQGRWSVLMRVAIGLRLEGNENWEEAATYVTEAERLGVDFAWSHESWGMDEANPLAFMAARTSRIRLGYGIMQAGTRTPALVAMTSLSLASMSAGRFVLGLGVSGPQVIEGWHGLRFDRPLTRMREIVEIVRRAARGERVAVKGRVSGRPLPGGEGKALRSSVKPRADIPVYLATLSPRGLELTGEIADGWLGTSFMPDHARIFFDHLEAGAKRAGRALGQLDLQAGGAVAFGDDVERVGAEGERGGLRTSAPARARGEGDPAGPRRDGARAAPRLPCQRSHHAARRAGRLDAPRAAGPPSAGCWSWSTGRRRSR